MFDSDFLATALGGEIPEGLKATRITSDSRDIHGGDLFAAIKGDRFDGHDFVADAFKQGAVAALVERGRKIAASALPLIRVDNVTEALRQLAKAHRQRLRLQVVAIAGSNGKTTTKEITAFLLRELLGHEVVFKTEKSQNSILGIALSLLQIREEKVAIIEIGIDEPGWMDQHLDVVAPSHGLITTIAEEHLNKLGSLEQVADEELKLLSYVAERGRSFAANLDSRWIASALERESHRLGGLLTYGLEARADIEGRFVAPSTLQAFGQKWINPLPGMHNAQNLLAALAVIGTLRPLDLTHLSRLREALPRFRGEPHRSLWLHFERDIQVYDDCYNANPDSMEKALQTFQQLSDGCIQRVIVGDMLDLGEATAAAHQRILNRIAVLGFDAIYLLGPHFAEALAQMSLAPPEMRSFLDHQALQSALQRDLKDADTLFFKGSRGMRLEKILDGLPLAHA